MKLRRKATFLAVASLFAEAAFAQTIAVGTLPTGGSVTAGAATIGTSGSTMTVRQESARALIDWTSFSVGRDAAVNFNHVTGNKAVTANRVPLGASQSVIEGMLSANGNVMILNANGVLFGATARVNVGGLVASTGGVDDSHFGPSATGAIAIKDAKSGKVTNEARPSSAYPTAGITVADTGLVAFVAPQVVNSGIITATTGRIVLASAEAATLSLNGNNLYELAVTKGILAGSVEEQGVTNTGDLLAAGGTIVISALDAANVVSGVINLEGVQQATRIEVHGGEVYLKSDLNAVAVDGTSATIKVFDGAQIQDAVAIARSSGATVEVLGGDYSGEVALTKAGMTVSGSGGATLAVEAGKSGFKVDANDVTIEGMNIVGPYSAHYKDVNWDAAPGITAGVRIEGNRSGTKILNNDIRNLRQGVLMVEEALDTTITGNTIDNTKGSILLRAEGATITGNKFDANGNEWDIVLLQNISDGAYFTSPHVSQKLYGAQMMAMSAANGGMHILDRRYGSNGLLAPTPQFGNRSHIVVGVGSNFTAADDFNLGNGLGNLRQPLGFIVDGINTVVHGGYVDVLKGTYVQASTLKVNKPVTLRGAGQTGPNATIIDARGVSTYGILVTGDDVSLSDFTLYGPTADVGSSYGIKVQPKDGAASSRLRNFAIKDVTSRGAGRAELDLHAVVGATIDGVTADGMPYGATTGTTKGAGIQITDSENVVIRNSITKNNEWGGVALYQANRFYSQETTNIAVEASNDFQEKNPLYLQDESASKDFGALSLQGFSYAVRNQATVGTVIQSQYTWMQKTAQAAYDYAVDKVANPATSYVRGWNGTALTQDFYVGVGSLAAGGTRAMSINHAIGTASAGAAVRVDAGTYAESVLLDGLRNLLFNAATVEGLTVTPGASGSGISGSVTASGSTGFIFNAPVYLLGNTSLATTGANIAFNGDVQGFGGNPYALSLNAGTGNVTMVSGGSSGNPLGRLEVDANNFTLLSTLWVSGYDINALGTVALSDHTLRSVGGGVTNEINAGGDITGSTVAESPVQVDSGGSVVGSYTAPSIILAAQEAVSVAVNAPGPVQIHSDGPASVTGSAPALVIDAPSGSVSGDFGQVTNSGGGLIEVNGKPQLNTRLAETVVNYDRVIPVDITTAASPDAGSTPQQGKVRRRKAEDAAEVLENGESLEIDLSPGN
jgi:filamentous hemagglutinin family protein